MDAADERGDQGDAGLGAGDRLGEAEEQRHVAVDALVLEPLGRANALPGRGDLDQDPLAIDAVGLVEADQPARLVDRRLSVEGEPGVDLGRDAAGDDLEDLLAEGDEQAIDAGLDLCVVVVAFGLGRADDLLEQPAVSRHLRRLQQERGVRRGVAGLVLGDRLEVAAIGDDHSHLAQLFQEVHLGPFHMNSDPRCAEERAAGRKPRPFLRKARSINGRILAHGETPWLLGPALPAGIGKAPSAGDVGNAEGAR